MSDIKLGKFDDPGDDDDFDLSPRRRKSTTSKTPPTPAEPDPGQETTPAEQEPAATRASSRTRPPTKSAPTPKVSDQAKKMTASNLQVPAQLMEQIKQVRAAEGVTTGELFIVAIETTYDQLKDEFKPKSTGGSLFSSNARKTQRPDKGPLAQLNFRMLSSDIEVLDRLVDEFGLESRGHLVSEALEKYFNREGD